MMRRRIRGRRRMRWKARSGLGRGGEG